MIKILFFLAFFSTQAFSSLTGTWAGKGKAIELSGNKECDFIGMKLVEKESRFSIIGGGYDCGPLKASYDFSEFKIEKGKLYYKGKYAGDHKDGQVILKGPNGVYELFLKIKDNMLVFVESWIEGDDYLFIGGQLYHKD